MKQCEAQTLPTSYSPAHRCEKTAKLILVRGRLLCAHHRSKTARPFEKSRN